MMRLVGAHMRRIVEGIGVYDEVHFEVNKHVSGGNVNTDGVHLSHSAVCMVENQTYGS